MPTLTDRSRMAAMFDCPRLRWNRYHAEGTGLTAKSEKLALVAGNWLHQGIESLFGGEGIDRAIEVAHDRWWELVESCQDTPHFVPEQRALLEGLLRCWAIERLPKIREEFDLVLAEQELIWPMAPDIHDMLRVDALLRRRSGGGLYYLEVKSTSTGGDRWAASWQRHSQLLANVQAIEETLGERCEGVMIEGIVKGRRAKDRDSRSPMFEEKVQQSPLCYMWINEATGEESAEYQRAKDWRKVPTWEHLPIAEWVSKLSPEVRAKQFSPVPPITPQRAQLVRFRRQAVAQERLVAQAIEWLGSEEARDPERREFIMDTCFPLNDNHCRRFLDYPCEFEALCFTPEIEADPLGSGLYERRVPHHPAELEEGVR